VEVLRVDAARRLLEDSERNIDQISRMCGFGDEDRMRLTFRRNLGGFATGLSQPVFTVSPLPQDRQGTPDERHAS
jgi:methylphosphotriester-DNA--protein-cysteine methyltransferase